MNEESKLMRETKEQALDEFVEDLFSNNSGDRADRLVLWKDADRRNLGGWNREAVKSRLRKLTERDCWKAED